MDDILWLSRSTENDIKIGDTVYIKNELLEDVVVHRYIYKGYENDEYVYVLETYHSIVIHYDRDELLTEEEYRNRKIDKLLK